MTAALALFLSRKFHISVYSNELTRPPVQDEHSFREINDLFNCCNSSAKAADLKE